MTVAFLRPTTVSAVLIELVISPYIKNILKQKIAFFPQGKASLHLEQFVIINLSWIGQGI